MTRPGRLLVPGLVSVVVLTMSACSATPFPKTDALSVLQAAARRTLASAGATLAGTMNDDRGPVVQLSGRMDFRDRTSSITTSSARGARYRPFETRLVAGWQYVEIDKAMTRPRALRPDVDWVAFQGPPGRLPIPDRTLTDVYLFEILDRIQTDPVAAPQLVGPHRALGAEVRFGIPSLDTASFVVTDTMTIGADGRIAELSTATRADGKPAVVQTIDLSFTWTKGVVPVVAPAASRTQRLTPGESLYPSTSTTTTTPPTAAVPGAGLGAISRSEAVAGSEGLFDGDRADLEAALRAQPDPRLTTFSFDSGSNTITATFAYAHPTAVSRAVHDAFAFHVAGVLGDTFWSPELVQSVATHGVLAAWLPNLRIQLDADTYSCASVTQVALAAHTITQTAWLQKCAG